MIVPPRKPQSRPTTKTVSVPAPIGGLNTISAASDMPATDSVAAFNVIAAEYGLRVRLGYQEYVTGLTGNTDATVRSIIPFTGSYKNQATDKLFATTQTGIWDVTASTATPTRVVTFAHQDNDAGFGVSCVTSNVSGRYLVYCDEENGLYIYTENTASWAKIALGTAEQWETNTGYLVGNKVANAGKVYVCATQGTSSATPPGPISTGTGIADGTNGLTWNYVGAVSTTVIGPSLNDQQNGLVGDPANFVFCTVWKNRLWFVEKDTTRGWYLDFDSIYGVAKSFDFGSRMRAGGLLVGLFNWSYDGGSGMDTLLVGISSAGDIVIYQGTDPDNINTFSLKGTWYVGGVPYGRRIATDHGGDLLVMSLLGVVPLSKLVIGNSILDKSQYETYKISNLFSKLVSLRQNFRTWSMVMHPTDNALILTIPTSDVTPTEQLVMSFANHSWSQYKDLPIYSAGVLRGQMYIGTHDGRVCLNTGYVDDVKRDDTSNFRPVSYFSLGAYQNLGNGNHKRVAMIRPSVLADTASPIVQATALFGFDMNEPPDVSFPYMSSDTSSWDTAIWGSSRWASADFVPTQVTTGASGIGRHVAIAIQGRSSGRTIYTGSIVYFDVGGIL